MFEIWMYLTDNRSITAEHNCTTKHGSKSQLGNVVLHCITRMHNLHRTHLAATGGNLPFKRRNHSSHSSYQGSLYRGPMVHKHRHTGHHRSLVFLPSTGPLLWRHGSDSYYTHGSVLRHRHSNQRRLQQLPLDHHHPCSRRSKPGESSLELWPPTHNRQRHHRIRTRFQPLRRASRIRKLDYCRSYIHLPYRCCTYHSSSRPTGRRQHG